MVLSDNTTLIQQHYTLQKRRRDRVVTIWPENDKSESFICVSLENDSVRTRASIVPKARGRGKGYKEEVVNKYGEI